MFRTSKLNKRWKKCFFQLKKKNYANTLDREDTIMKTHHQ